MLLALEAFKRVAGQPAAASYEARNALLTTFERNARLTTALHGVNGQADAIAFTPDGRMVAVAGSEDHEHAVIRIWDVRRRAPVGRAIHTEVTYALRFTEDGKTLLSASAFGTLHAFDPVRGVERHRSFAILPFVRSGRRRFVDDPGSALLSDNARIAITGGPHGAITAWETATGEPLVWHEAAGDPGRMLAAVSADGHYFGVVDRGHVLLWDVARRRSIRTPTVRATTLAFGDAARTVAFGDGQRVALWNLARGRLSRSPLRAPYPVDAVALAPDGHWLAAAGGGEATLWNLRREHPVPRELRGHDPVYNLQFTPNSKTLVVEGTTTRFVNVATRTTLPDPISFPPAGASDGFTSWEVSPDGTAVASAGDDGAVRLWSLAAHPALQSALLQKPDPAQCCEGAQSLVFSPDGKTLAAGEHGGAGLWDAIRGTRLGRLVGTERGMPVAFSPDGSFMASLGAPDDRVGLWSTKSRELLRLLSPASRASGPVKDESGAPNDFAFSPDGATIAVAYDDNTIRFFDVKTGRPLGRMGDAGDQLAFSPDGRLLVSGFLNSSRINVWGGRRHLRLPSAPLTSGEGVFGGLTFSRDGRALAAPGSDGTVRLWTVSNSTLTADPPRRHGHSNTVNAVAFNPDSRVLVSAGDDGSLRLWDVARDAPLGRPLAANDGTVEALAVSSRSSIVASYFDGTIRTWDPLLIQDDVAAWQKRICGVAGRSLTQTEWRTLAPDEPHTATCPGRD
jgi:WD40 repeat protein